jgi:ribosomal protein S18 acetylase RimI-like enzyme
MWDWQKDCGTHGNVWRSIRDEEDHADLFQEFVSASIPGFMLNFEAENTGALAFYRKLGYRLRTVLLAAAKPLVDLSTIQYVPVSSAALNLRKMKKKTWIISYFPSP